MGGLATAMQHDKTPPPLAPGSLVNDRYEIRQSLGKGGMGEVFLAYDRSTQEPVALKVGENAFNAQYLATKAAKSGHML